jgi:3-methyladenine DNA glycosylase/8-oxoguanine DNA glycosylase
MAELSESSVEALVVAVLAVGGWPAERVVSALPALRAAGVIAPQTVANMDLGVLTVALAKNGYGRGLLTSTYAERLQALMREVASAQLDGLPDLVRSGDQAAFVRRLVQIHGVGPKVASRAWELMTKSG